MTTVTLARLREMTPRLYQETILSSCVDKNTLVVLPTGLGKTAIALMLAIHRLSLHPDGKIVFLAPTKPLCEQHCATFKRHCDAPEESFVIFTGEVSPEKRERQWADAQFIFATPQGLENDIISSRVPLDDVTLMVFDEAHRAVGDYSYVFLAKRYLAKAKFPHLLALTASPGSDIEKIVEVCTNLHIEGVEVRSLDDEDVNPYTQDVVIRPVRVDLPPGIIEVRRLLLACIKSRVSELNALGVRIGINPTRKEVLGAQAEMRRMMNDGDRGPSVLKVISVLAEVMKIQHALELVESQGLAPLLSYFQKLLGEAEAGQSKAVKNLVRDDSFKAAHYRTQRLIDDGVEHPKMAAAAALCNEALTKNPTGKVILFTQFRDTAARLQIVLREVPGLLPEMFVGQAKKNGVGLSQKKQVEMLEQFKDGLFNVLIATCVAEEGLDIPSVDLVVFYEPVPSAIRTIQRRGRTGRHEDGAVHILIARGTRDEAYAASAKYKERNMNDLLQELRTTLNRRLLQQPQATLTRFETQAQQQNKPGPGIIVDFREKGSGCMKQLLERGADVRLEMLPVGDYVISDRCGVEFKTQEDFVNSILDGRLLEQLRALRQTYERPIILVEGAGDIYAIRNVHPNSIRGMLAAICVAYGIPILWSRSSDESAQLLWTIAEREQNENGHKFAPHNHKKPLSLSQQQEYALGAFPSIGPSIAKQLLTSLGSVKNVVNAPINELKKVDGVGEKKAQSIFDVFNKEYKKE